MNFKFVKRIKTIKFFFRFQPIISINVEYLYDNMNTVNWFISLIIIFENITKQIAFLALFIYRYFYKQLILCKIYLVSHL